MDEAVGGTPEEDHTQGEYVRHWALNYARYSVKIARKIVERDMFRLQQYTRSEKNKYMAVYRRELTEALNAHFEKWNKNVQKT
jgi:hypothetical protein